MMPEEILFDVFISYRRKGGSEQAQLVKSELRQRGIADNRIFLDTHSLHEGDFRQKIAKAISLSINIVVIISKGCFDEVRETDYWYMEIREAMKQGKRIIPILFDNIVSLDALSIPSDLNELKNRNFIRYQHEYAEATFDKLIAFLALEQAHTIAKNPPRRGCLMKYRGCMFSLVLIILLLVVIVPIVLQEEDSSTTELTAMNDKEAENESQDETTERRPKLPSSQEKDDNLDLASSKLGKSEEPVGGKKASTIGVKKLSWAKYDGNVKDGVYHGYGTLTITKPHSINDDVAQPGERIKGYFSNGQIEKAIWYRNDGKEVVLKDIQL